MRVFVEVAKLRGFAPAARELGLSTSSVSRHVLNLEQRLNRQLFSRTTRSLSLTPAGSDLLEECQRIVYDAEALLDVPTDEARTPSGRMRITLPGFLAELLSRDAIARYALRYPEVKLEVVVMNRVVNLVEEGFDLALRVGELSDSTLIARKLLDLHLVMVASPAYIARRGEPRLPSDLKVHDCIVETDAPYIDRWPLRTGGASKRYPVNEFIRVNSGDTARDLAVGGVGLCLLPVYLVLRQLERGELVTVMREHVPDYGGIFAVYPQTRYVTPAVRSFIEFLVAYAGAIRLP